MLRLLLLVAAAISCFAAEETKLDEIKVLKGFRYEVLLEKDLPEPMDLEFSPDGKLWATGRGGQLFIVSLDRGGHRKVATLEVDHSEDRGLHGIEFHPGYTTNGFVYLYFSPPATNGFRNRLSRFTITKSGNAEQLDRASEVIFLEWPSEKIGFHQGGAIEYSPVDQKLYISTGDNNWNNDLEKYYLDPQNRAQSVADLRGKTLRLNLDGSIPSDNPFVKEKGARQEIFTVGHRQPFTLAVDPVTGVVFEGENGAIAPMTSKRSTS